MIYNIWYWIWYTESFLLQKVCKSEVKIYWKNCRALHKDEYDQTSRKTKGEITWLTTLIAVVEIDLKSVIRVRKDSLIHTHILPKVQATWALLHFLKCPVIILPKCTELAGISYLSPAKTSALRPVHIHLFNGWQTLYLLLKIQSSKPTLILIQSNASEL